MKLISKYFGSLKVIALIVITSCASTKINNSGNTITIKEQGSFTVGGTVIQNAGTFDINKAKSPDGQTLHGDHAYVFYQIPVNAKKYPLIFLHGAGESKKSWETTSDGREGFQNIFLKRGFGVYLLDQPRRGEAGKSTISATVTPTADEQFWFTQFRIGNYPDYFPNVKFPKDSVSLEQFFRKMTPNTGSFDANVVSDAVSALFNKIGEGILVTHSQGCGPGWSTAIKNKNVKAVIAYEPFSGFVFPTGELPAPIKSTGLFGDLKGTEIPNSDFKRLTEIPIVIYYGDNIAATPTTVWNKDHWRAGLEMAKLWVAKVNEHGGNAKVVHLPEIGIYGNTHFMFSDLNNIQIADLMSQFLKEKNLDK
jgi:pimeloyl-ACP methyl ester carboxylesterase